MKLVKTIEQCNKVYAKTKIKHPEWARVTSPDVLAHCRENPWIEKGDPVEGPACFLRTGYGGYAVTFNGEDCPDYETNMLLVDPAEFPTLYDAFLHTLIKTYA